MALKIGMRPGKSVGIENNSFFYPTKETEYILYSKYITIMFNRIKNQNIKCKTYFILFFLL